MLNRILIGSAIVAVVIALAFFTRAAWLPWFSRADDTNDEEAHGPIVAGQQVKLSEQAQANLRLVVKPLEVTTYWKTIQVPGSVVDRPAQSDRGIVAPATAVVTRVHRFPGDTVKPGETLFTLRLLSETLQLSQSELFRAAQEQEITLEKKKRLADPKAIGAVSEATRIELDNQLRRLNVTVQAQRQELLIRGLTPAQIDGVAEGKYVTTIEIKAPQSKGDSTFEVQELRVELGQQVQAGHTLCLLSNHQSLYIEGRAFRQETHLIEKAVKEGWPVQVDFMEDEAAGWPALDQTFMIRHIANTIDPASRTFAFYLPLANQSRSIAKNDGTLLLWRFRPGQKVRLHVRVEKLDNVFVLPADAVVREGPEAYVFRQNGDILERKPVQVIYMDRQHAVLANDGSVPAGVFVAQNAAVQINRVLKAGSSSLPSGFHMHADGSIHSNAAHK